MTGPEPGDVKSARRVLELLEYLAAIPGGRTFAQLTSDLGLPKSSLHGLLRTLTGQGWIYFHETTRAYRIGLRTWQVAQSYSHLDLLAHVAHRHLTALRDELNETVQLSVLDGTDNVYIAKVESDQPLRLVSNVGSRLPAYATGLGKVLLAYLEPAELRRRMSRVQIQPFTAHTVKSLKALERSLADIRAKGYGEDDGEYTVGVRCVAVPVSGPAGDVIAAISCSVPTVRLDDTDRERRNHLLRTLLRHARELSKELGSGLCE